MTSWLLQTQNYPSCIYSSGSVTIILHQLQIPYYYDPITQSAISPLYQHLKTVLSSQSVFYVSFFSPADLEEERGI